MFVSISCNKKQQAPTIQVVSPIENQAFVTEGIIRVEANIEEDETINKVIYKIYGLETIYTPNSKTFKLEKTSSMYNIGGGNLEISIVVEDNDGNISSKVITVKHSY